VGAFLEGIPKCVEETRVLELWPETQMSSQAPATGKGGGDDLRGAPKLARPLPRKTESH